MALIALASPRGTPTPSPDKVEIWALKLARHTDAVTTHADVTSTRAYEIAKHSDFVAIVTLGVTLGALIAAIVALLVAFRALYVAIADAENNSTQLRLALARARFALKLSVQLVDDIVDLETHDFEADQVLDVLYRRVALRFEAMNVGNKVTSLFQLAVCVRESVLEPVGAPFRRSQQIDGEEYRVYRKDGENFNLFPLGEAYGFAFDLKVWNNAKSAKILWKMFDENGSTPDDGFGEIVVDLTKDAVYEYNPSPIGKQRSLLRRLWDIIIGSLQMRRSSSSDA